MIMRLVLVMGVVLSCMMLVSQARADTASPVPDATPTRDDPPCPVTEPNEPLPPRGENLGVDGWFGNRALSTNVWMWGEDGVRLPETDEHVRADGAIAELKWAWYRYVSGSLGIEGRRLDGPAAPLVAEIPDGYGASGFQVSGLTFPSEGCWEVTGSVGTERLTFVVLVEVVEVGATPEAE